jgi:hypothetical protein
MNRWAKKFDLDNWQNDVLRIKKIGLATLQHLRMYFGADTVKPDRRVKQVLYREFSLRVGCDRRIVEVVTEMAYILHCPVLYLDSVLVNYGSGHYSKHYKEICCTGFYPILKTENNSRA